MPDRKFDIAIIGAGIIGLAVGRELSLRYPDLRLVILDKEGTIGRHQTSHNSGVIHSGLYYRPGSFKAKFCVAGAEAMKRYCEEHALPYRVCGKVVVAVSEDELPRLQTLYERGTANGVQGLELIGPERLREIEPYAAGVRAILCPPTGIVDYRQVAGAYASELHERGGRIMTNAEVRGIRRVGSSLILETALGDIEAAYLVNCAGLYADRIAEMMGVRSGIKIVPFRGEYYMIRPDRGHLVRNLIYPVPNPEFPFLGVHFTRTIHGEVEAGPNAVLAFAREGYARGRINPGELAGTLGFGGFWNMARRYWQMAAGEYYRSFSKQAFVRALQRLLPELQEEDLAPGGAGVRAQAVDAKGNLLDDFNIDETDRAIHVRNAPSPAATSSLMIGRYVADLAEKSFSLTPAKV